MHVLLRHQVFKDLVAGLEYFGEAWTLAGAWRGGLRWVTGSVRRPLCRVGPTLRTRTMHVFCLLYSSHPCHEAVLLASARHEALN